MSKFVNVFNRLVEAQQYFTKTRYGHIVKEASRFYERGDMVHCLEQLDKLPAEKDLLADLVNRLKGKSVHKTLERARKSGKKMLEMKCLSSLLTHTVIECEQGRLEYRRLIPMLLERLNDVGFGILSEGE